MIGILLTVLVAARVPGSGSPHRLGDRGDHRRDPRADRRHPERRLRLREPLGRQARRPRHSHTSNDAHHRAPHAGPESFRAKPEAGFEPATYPAYKAGCSGQLSYSGRPRPVGRLDSRSPVRPRPRARCCRGRSRRPGRLERLELAVSSLRRRSSSARTTPNRRWRQAAWAKARRLPPSGSRSARAGWWRSTSTPSGQKPKCSAIAAPTPRERRSRHQRARERVHRAEHRAVRHVQPSPAAGHAGPRVTSLPSSSTSS